LKKLFIILLLIPILSSAQQKNINSLGFERIYFGSCVEYSYDGNPFNDNEETLWLSLGAVGDRIWLSMTKSDISPFKIEWYTIFTEGPFGTRKYDFKKHKSVWSETMAKKVHTFEFIFDGDKSTYFKLTESRSKEIKSLDDEFFLKLKKHKNVIIRRTTKSMGTGGGHNDTYVNLSGITAGFNKFSGVKAPSIKNKNSYAVANGLANVNPFNLDKYIDKFILDAKKNHNIDLSYVYKGDKLILFKELEKETIAVAYKKDEDDKVIVFVDPENWYAANQVKRWYIIYHELGHDILNLEHGECGAMMNANASGSYSWSRLERDKIIMFNAYKKKK